MIVKFVKKLNLEFDSTVSFALGNPAMDATAEKTIISVIRIEEEATMKNIPNVKFKNNTYQKKNPQIYINYYLMFCNTNPSYEDALLTIEKIIKFFQKTRTLELGINTNTINTAIMDLFTPSFDQLNQIWSIHGGKHYPNVIYKVRVGAYEDAGEGDNIKPIRAITKTIGHDN